MYPDPQHSENIQLTPSPLSLVEMFVGIGCACLPSLRPFARHHFPRLFDGPSESLRPDHERVKIRSPASVELHTGTGRPAYAGKPPGHELPPDKTVASELSETSTTQL